MNAQEAPVQRIPALHRRRDLKDAPTWLWSSVVDLIGIHERAYLEHCRRYALMQERVSGATDSNGDASTLALITERAKAESVA